MELVLLQTIVFALVDIMEVFATFTLVMGNYPTILQHAPRMDDVLEKNNVFATLDTLERIATWIFVMEKHPTIQVFVVHMEHVHLQIIVFVHLVTLVQIALPLLVLIEILALLKEPVLEQIIVHAILNTQEQTAPFLFVTEKALLLLVFVLEMVIATLQIIVFVFLMDILVHFVTIQFVLLSQIALQMVYVLVLIIALVSVVGKIPIAVHSIAIQ
jgi:hypothetical protein